MSNIAQKLSMVEVDQKPLLDVDAGKAKARTESKDNRQLVRTLNEAT
jgi:hypothetical protein